jgi:hypothetical protein
MGLRISCLDIYLWDKKSPSRSMSINSSSVITDFQRRNSISRYHGRYIYDQNLIMHQLRAVDLTEKGSIPRFELHVRTRFDLQRDHYPYF